MTKEVKISKNILHTWLIDVDGTMFKHNGYLTNGKDQILPGVKIFWKKIPKNDKIIILTARKKKFKKETIETLRFFRLRFNEIIFDLPFGERILINDTKPFGLKTSLSLNIKRDFGLSGIKIIKL